MTCGRRRRDVGRRFSRYSRGESRKSDADDLAHIVDAQGTLIVSAASFGNSVITPSSHQKAARGQATFDRADDLSSVVDAPAARIEESGRNTQVDELTFLPNHGAQPVGRKWGLSIGRRTLTGMRPTTSSSATT
jgi:hypothetical protein